MIGDTNIEIKPQLVESLDTKKFRKNPEYNVSEYEDNSYTADFKNTEEHNRNRPGQINSKNLKFS